MLPRVDLGYVIISVSVWNSYEEMFAPQSETKKALMTLSSQTKEGNVTTNRTNSSIFFQRGAQVLLRKQGPGLKLLSAILGKTQDYEYQDFNRWQFILTAESTQA